MKKILLIWSFAIATNSMAQKVALFDTKFEKPIIFTDSVTAEQAAQGYFPVGIENFDTLYANLNYIKTILSKRQMAKMKSFELKAGSTIITVTSVPFAYGDRYLAVAKTKINEVESNYIVTNYKISNASNSENIKRMMSYMKNNKSLFRYPNEINPRIYNVVIMSE